MKLGVLSDVHGNIEALAAVIESLRAAGATHFACCGDIVGYGPDPAACVAEIRRLRCPAVAGNHDHGALGRIGSAGFNHAAAAAIDWTRPLIVGDDRQFLEELPLTLVLGRMQVVHSSPSAPQLWEYIITVREAEEEMKHFAQDICVVGHSHLPFAVERLPGEPARLVRESEFELHPDAKYVINVGSVGQPRDGDPRACCLFHDSRTGRARFLRVPYDVAAVQRKMRRAGLPESLTARLAVGR